MNALATSVCGRLTETKHSRPLKRRCESVNCGEEESWLREHVGPENQKWYLLEGERPSQKEAARKQEGSGEGRRT